MSERSGYRQAIYAKYASNSNTVPVEERLRRRMPFLTRIVRDHFCISRDSQILDVGCGDGAFLRALRNDDFVNLVGVDVSPEQVALARSLGIGKIYLSDVSAFIENTAESSFDVVIAFDVIEHFTKSEIIGILRNLFRILRPGGRVVMHVPNGGAPFAGRVLHGDFTHEVAFTPQSITQVLLSLGFCDVSCYEDTPASTGIRGIVRRLLWKLVRSMYVSLVVIEAGGLGSNDVFSQNMLCIARK